MHSEQHIFGQAVKFSALLCACMLLPVLVVFLFSPAPAIYPLWDWANTMGYLVIASTTFLLIYKGRARSFPAYSGQFFANLHRDLGYITAILLAGHVSLLLYAEPLLLEHMKPTAPLHMLSGWIALILMSLLLATSIPAMRRRIWQDYHFFRRVHAMLAVAVIGLGFYHVVFSGFYLNENWKTALYFVIATGTVVWSVAFSKPAVSSGNIRIRNSSGFSHLITYGCTTVVLVLCLVIVLVKQTRA